MSKIERYQGNVQAFASGAQGVERTVFGEATQANDLTSQITAAFLRGWGIVGPSEHPSLEDFNGAMYALSQFIAYQHQAGIPEWHEEQEYYAGSVCTHSGVSYQSLEGANIGHEPPSSHWTPVLTAKNGLANLGLGTAAKKDVGTGSGQLPDMSSFTMSQSGDLGNNNGYFKLPNGLIIQWVSASSSGTSGLTTLPMTFPNGTLFALVTDSVVSGGASTVSLAWRIDTTTKSEIGWVATIAPGAFCILAIGY